ncbi:MAG: DUF4270 family protein [Pelobium sp.]
MKFIKSDLLTLLIGLFILGGCKNPSGIGLDVDPANALSSNLDTTVTVTTKLLRPDSTLVNFTEKSALGYFKDPIFGTTTNNMAVALTLPNASFSFGANTSLDSAVLVLPLSGFYGDSLNTNYTLEVRQLNELLYNETKKTYYDNKKWSFKSNLLATKNFGARYRDSIIIQDIIVGKKDTVKKVIPQLRIKLDPTFITNMILKSDTLNLVSNKAFSNYFKGLYISLNKNSTTNNGGTFLFDTYSTGAARLDIFYKKKTNAIVDTLNTSLAIAGSNGFAVTELTWDMAGTAVQSTLQNPATSNNKLYLQSFNGTYVKVDFPDLNKLKTLGTNIAINRAEIVLKIDQGSETPYIPIPRLRIYRWDIANRPQFLPDEIPGEPRSTGVIGGFYNAAKKEYVFNCPGYIQDLLSGRLKNYGTFITTTDFTRSFYNILQPQPVSTLSQPARSVTGGGTNVTYRTFLRVYYTNLN